MTISKDLFLAILSMDAYNRGYGAGIADGGEDDPDGLGESGFIGGARILARDDGIDYAAWQTAGFYAVAYTMGDGDDVPKELRGKTVISYRGTDDLVVELANDLLISYNGGAVVTVASAFGGIAA